MTVINWHKRAGDTHFCIRNLIKVQSLAQPNAKNTDTVLIQKVSPRDGKLLYEIGVGTNADVAQAASSAKRAFDDDRWRTLPVSQRQTVLKKLAELMETHRDTFALNECLDVGKPISEALAQDIPGAAGTLRSAADKADKLLSPSGANGNQFVYRQYQPVGVVVGIMGWNFPLLLAAQKVGPALVGRWTCWPLSAAAPSAHN